MLKETDGGEKKAVTSTNGCAGLEKYFMNSVLSANEPGERWVTHLNCSSVDVCTPTWMAFGLLLLIKHLTMDNWVFIQLDGSWKGLCFVVAKSWLYLRVREALLRSLWRSRGSCISEDSLRAGESIAVSVTQKWTHTRHKAHTEPSLSKSFQHITTGSANDYGLLA